MLFQGSKILGAIPGAAGRGEATRPHGLGDCSHAPASTAVTVGEAEAKVGPSANAGSSAPLEFLHSAVVGTAVSCVVASVSARGVEPCSSSHESMERMLPVAIAIDVSAAP